MTQWRLVVAPSARRSMARLGEPVAAAIIELMVGPLCDDPVRVGTPLRDDLTGYRSARRGSYRVVYRVNEDRREVQVVRIEHRSDVYRPR